MITKPNTQVMLFYGKEHLPLTNPIWKSFGINYEKNVIAIYDDFGDTVAIFKLDDPNLEGVSLVSSDEDEITKTQIGVTKIPNAY